MPLHDMPIQSCIHFHRSLQIHRISLLIRAESCLLECFRNHLKLNTIFVQLDYGKANAGNRNTAADAQIVEGFGTFNHKDPVAGFLNAGRRFSDAGKHRRSMPYPRQPSKILLRLRLAPPRASGVFFVFRRRTLDETYQRYVSTRHPLNLLHLLFPLNPLSYGLHNRQGRENA